MPVVCAGKKLGRISCVLPDSRLESVSGVFLHCGLAGSRFIGCAELDMIGDVAVLAHSAGIRRPTPERPFLRRAYSPDGRRIGAITDAVIDEETLRIEALEFSRGYLDDLTGGRLHIRQFRVRQNGDVIVESSEGGNLV